MVRGLAERVSGDQSEGAFRPALVESKTRSHPASSSRNWRTAADGPRPVGADARRRCAVRPAAGARAPLDVPFTQAVKVISKWGVGAGSMARGVSVGSLVGRP